MGSNRRRQRTKAVHPAIASRAGRPNQPVRTPVDPLQLLNGLTALPPEGEMVPLRRDPLDDSPFGPLPPLRPAPLDRLRPDSGRPEPRLSQYDVGWNLPGSGQRRIGFHVLRSASRDIDMLRRCIQIRKGHVTGLDWAWTLSDSAVEEAMIAGKHGSRLDAESALRERMQPEIARLTAFWERPWRSNGLTFRQWISLVIEEVLSIDALAIYPRMTLGGQLLDLEILDGTLIKPLRDWRGALPQDGHPAFQQLLWGFPRGEFTVTLVDTAQGKVAPGAFLSDQLYYYRSVPFTDTPYGMSQVEQAIISGRLYLLRQNWLIAEYDDGASPNTWLVPDKDVANLGNEPYTAQRRAEYQRLINDDLRGNTSERQRVQLSLPGFKPEWPPSVDSKYKSDYDQHLITILASHMDVTMAELGFVQSGGLGSSGFHEGQEDVQFRKGTRPTVEMLTEIILELSRAYLGAPRELTFKFLGLEAEDEAAQDTIAQSRVATGRMTLNEDRDRLGLPRYAFAEADMPQLQTGRGVVFLEGASQTAPPGQLVGPAQAMPAGPQDGEAQDEDTQDAEDEQPGEQNKPPAAVGKASPAQAAEIASFRRFLTKAGAVPARPFLFKTMSIREALGCGAVDPADIGVTATFQDLVPKA